VNPKAYSLVVSLPISDEGEGEGTLEELEFRHHLEDVLSRVLRKKRLGHVDGGGQGGGYQDVFMYVYPPTWEKAWELVRAKLAEMGLLERAFVIAGLEEGQPARKLWPPFQENTAAVDRINRSSR
jgi:hypothetical protein